MSHVYCTVEPHRVVGDAEPTPDAIAAMKSRMAQWPNCRWAASQCVALDSSNVGSLRFTAVGPENQVRCVSTHYFSHWSYVFVGWVNLATGKIQSLVPSQ